MKGVNGAALLQSNSQAKSNDRKDKMNGPRPLEGKMLGIDLCCVNVACCYLFCNLILILNAKYVSQ